MRRGRARRTEHVVVVGGGAAGLAAAAALRRRGVRVTVIEARERLGGRVDTVADPVLGVAIERGAEFVHGRPPATVALARRAGAALRVVPDRHRLRRGTRLADGGEAYAAAQEVLKLGTRDDEPLDPVLRRGRAEVRARGAAGGRLDPVQAGRVVVTVPLPMIRDGALRFVPGVPEKRRAAAALAMGPIVKVILRFRRPAWPTSGRDRLVFLHVPGGAVPVFWTLAPVEAPVLVGWAGGPDAARLAGRAEDEVLRAALGAAGRGLGVAPRALEAALDGAAVVDWTRDPYARGGYAVFPVGSRGAGARLAGSVAETLFFAGEATAGDEAGTVEGALRSGERAAREVLATL